MTQQIDTELIGDLEAVIRKYVYLPSDEHYRVTALYVVHTWCFDAAHVTPYLFIYSAHPGSGKTRLLEILSGLCRNARRADNMTVPIMFKLIERECPTLLIDEVDAIWSGSRNEDKRMILNTGYKKGGSAWRQVARSLEEYSTFAPKVLAGLKNGMLPATIYDRCIPIGMQRRPKGTKLERFIESEFSASREVDALIERIFQFKDDHLITLTYQLPEALATLSDRQNEIAEPLLQIASVFGVEDSSRAALEAIFADENGLDAMSPEATLLMRIRDAFGLSEKAHTEVLLRSLPGFNARTLALNVEKFGIAPKDVRMGNSIARGYLLADFADAFEQYLPAVHEAEQITAEAADEEVSA